MTEKRKIFPLALSPKLLEAVKREASSQEQTVSAIIRRMLVERLIKQHSTSKDQTSGS